MTRLRPSLRAILIGATMLSAPVILSTLAVTPAYALFGFGDVVFDPTNYAEAVEQSPVRWSRSTTRSRACRTRRSS